MHLYNLAISTEIEKKKKMTLRQPMAWARVERAIFGTLLLLYAFDADAHRGPPSLTLLISASV
jgi:hypothetical protein